MKRFMFLAVLIALASCGCGGGGEAGRWHVVDVPTANDLTGVARLSSGEVWVAGTEGTLLVLRDGEWQEGRTYFRNDIHVLCRVGGGEIWGGLAFGGLIRYNGEAWLKVKQMFTAQNITVIFVRSDGAVCATGDTGDVLIYEDGEWSRHSQAPAALSGLGEDSDGTLMGFGGGWFWMYVDGRWEREGVQIEGEARAFVLREEELLCFNYNNCFRLDGSWRGRGNPARQAIYAAVFPEVDCGWAVGDGGKIIRWGGERWEKEASPTTEGLRAVDFVGRDEGWAAGNNGTVLHYY